MSRLGVLYALKEDELNKLRSLPHDERYDYMLAVSYTHLTLPTILRV